MIATVVGLGKLGLPMALALDSKGLSVFGYDKDPLLVGNLRRRVSSLQEPGVPELLAKARVEFTFDLPAAVSQSDVTFVIVPTPSQEDGRFSATYVEEALSALSSGLQASCMTGRRPVVVITSTVMPGSCARFRTLLEEHTGLACGLNFGLAYSPEFIALGSVIKNFLFPDLVLIGADDELSNQGVLAAYKLLFDHWHLPAFCQISLVNAELAKLALNSYVTLKVSFANQIATLCERFPGGDVDQVLATIGHDRRIGAAYLRAGTPFGGPCFPRDGRALRALGHLSDTHLPLSLATDRTNEDLLQRLVAEPQLHFVAHDAPILIAGLSYKPGTPVMEEAAAGNLHELLVEHGYSCLWFYDPLLAPDGLAERAARAKLIYLLHPDNFGIQHYVRPGTVVVDPWRVARDLPEGVVWVPYGYNPGC